MNCSSEVITNPYWIQDGGRQPVPYMSPTCCLLTSKISNIAAVAGGEAGKFKQIYCKLKDIVQTG